MAGEKRSRIVLEAEARGFDRAERAASKMRDALDTTKVAKQLKQTEKAVTDITKSVDGLSKSLGKVDFRKSFTDAASAIAAAEMKLEDFDRALAAVEAKQEERERKAQTRKSFRKGIVQGLGVGEYFSDNEDMRANVAGRAIGNAGRRVGGLGASVAGSAWTGSQGVLQGIAGIPVVGGAMSGALGSALGMSQEYLSFAQTQQDASVYGRVGGSSLRPQRIGSTKAFDPLAQPADSRSLLGKNPLHFRGRGSVDAIPAGPELDDAMAQHMRKLRDEDFDRRTAGPQTLSGAPTKTKSEGIYSADPLAFMSRSGLDFGLNKSEALRFSSGLAQSSGGSLQDINDKTFRTALAAKQGLGIDEGTSGSFMRGSRLGAGGGGIEGFEKAISRGLALGLEGSDLQRYMAQMAATLDEFETTGMPLDVDALQRAQTQLGGAFGANRGNVIAGGMLSAGRGLSQMGASNATQFQMLQDVYGYKGGGIDEYVGAMERAESGDMGDVGNFFNNLTKGGTSKSSKAAILKSRLGNDLGINIGWKEAQTIAGGDMGAFQERLREAAERTSGVDMQANAMGNINGSIRRQKGQENTRMGIGGKLVSSAQDFEDASINAAKSMSDFDGALKTISSLARNASIDLEKLFQMLGAFVNSHVTDHK